MLTAIGNGLGGDRSLSHRLSVAGFRAPNAAALFLGARTLVSVGPALLVLVPAVSSGKPLGRALMIAALYWAGGHLLANLWLKRRTRARVRQITRALPDALDLMVVCLEAGLGLNATIAKVGEERSTIADVLGRRVRAGGARAAQRAEPRGRAAGAQPPQRLRRPEGAGRPRHPERQARRQHGEDAADARRPAAHEAPPARRGGGPQAAHQDAVPAGALHPAGAVRRRRWAPRSSTSAICRTSSTKR